MSNGDRFKMLVTESLCWRLFSWCWWFSHQHPESATNISNLSPTHLVTNICHQHRCSHKKRSIPWTQIESLNEIKRIWVKSENFLYVGSLEGLHKSWFRSWTRPYVMISGYIHPFRSTIRKLKRNLNVGRPYIGLYGFIWMKLGLNFWISFNLPTWIDGSLTI